MPESRSTREPLFKVRNSKIHGKGVFALRRIRKGTRITEYVGDRVSHAEADRRYEDKAHDDNHTFLFIVDGRTVIDGGVDGNDARFINHSCDPNCESVVEDRRVFVEAIRTIEPGDELTYDYQITRDADDPDDIDEVFACRCGVAGCRGTMLWPAERRRATTSPRRRAAKKAGKEAAKRAAKRPAKQPADDGRARRPVAGNRAGRKTGARRG
jgi:SET domain-containing protein